MKNQTIIDNLEPVIKLNKDMMKALRAEGPGGITNNEARFLVDMYYILQKQRVQSNNRVKGLDRDAKKEGNLPEPHDILSWAFDQMNTLEDQVKKALAISQLYVFSI